ncbi:FkbM family methyltransferase [Salegentibacter salegens]|uniref:Methyltransferase, FkbM family n=1 Tax=Salegentibacter salegens TaxID=143223 RepID=A0A1M7NDW7_9FLAO|nr:FkbM family methyltransferase [Salegentibacter salegens]PRX41543.1 FkbM family methyltransferase [Salegentibacter salegens]SHN01818.1 methyltransferase, FkbM family [Salegentibacter salegens]
MRGWLIKILQAFKLLRFFNFNAYAPVNKKLFKIPLMGNTGIVNLQISEPWMTEILEFIVSFEKGKFVDVGVNLGQTLLKLKSVNSKTEYIGFEPNSHCVNYVSKLIKENRFENTCIIPVGISNEVSLAKLYFTTNSSTDSAASTIQGFRKENAIKFSNYITLLDVTTIENAVNLSGVSILKIDVEGGELEVLKSFHSRIQQDQPLILIEILPVYSQENSLRKKRQDEIEVLIKNLNYTIFKIIKHKKVLELEKIDFIGIHSDLNLCDYILVPKNRLKLFLERFNDV